MSKTQDVEEDKFQLKKIIFCQKFLQIYETFSICGQFYSKRGSSFKAVLQVTSKSCGYQITIGMNTVIHTRDAMTGKKYFWRI